MLDPGLNALVCSDEVSGINLAVSATSVAADHYDILNINVHPSLTAHAGNAVSGPGQAFDAIAADAFTNITAGPLQVIYDVVPVSLDGCDGDLVQITLTINPEPILTPSSPTVCSRENTGIVFTVAGGSTMALNYNVISFNVDAGLVEDAGNTVTIAVDGVVSTAITADKFINTTNAALFVNYEVAPVSLSACIGDTVLFTITVNPEPVLDPGLNTTVCSDAANGILLDVVATSVVAATYTINSINAEFGLIPNGPVAGPGPLQPATAISTDIYTNNTAGALTVTYTIVPVSGSNCNGQAVAVVVTINPEPTLANGLNTTVCSDVETSVVFDVAPGSPAALNYNIVGFVMDPSLTADPGNNVTAVVSGVAANAIQTDKFTNITAFPLTVVYDLVPVSVNLCEGNMKQVTVIVQPKPILTPGLVQTVCSGLPTSLALSVTNGVTGVIYNWAAPVNTGGMTGGTAGPSGFISDVFTNNTGAPQTATYDVIPVSGLGCPGEMVQVVITVNPNPSADINLGADPIFVCGGQDLLLDGNPVGGSGNYTHLWSGQVGSLDNILIQTPTFNTMFSADYSLTYTVTDDNGCRGTDQVIVTVEAPRALFSMDQNTGCASYDVIFTNNSFDATSYTWDFGDGSPLDNSVNPTHTFTNLTTVIEYFNVKLLAESVNGCVDSLTQVVTVYPSTSAVFVIIPDTICHSDDPVTLVAEPGAATYHWDFGDGNAGFAGSLTTHSFTNTTTGILTRTVTLTTESFFGCVEVATEEIVIYPMPVPNFLATPSVQTWPDNRVVFTNQTNIGTWTYLWDFGDGDTSPASDPTHDYLAPGLYQVTLEVSNSRCSDYVTKTVEIKPIAPIAEFEEVPPACNPYAVTFNNMSQNATSFFWDFGDGNTSNVENPKHTFYNAGSYNVILTAYGPGGQDQYQQLVEVYLTPSSFLDVAPDLVYVNDKPVQYFNLSSNGDTYLWEFGDGVTDTVFQPTHVYSEEGIYDVTLHVYTTDGCEDTYILSPAVTVEPAGDLRFATAFKPNRDGPTGGEIPTDLNLINTVFFPPIQQQIDAYHLRIFNRWGELLFESKDIDIGWDGYYRQKLCQQDVYVWQVTGKYSNGKPYRQAGDITLLH